MQNRRKFIKTMMAGTAGITLLNSFDLINSVDSGKEIKLTILHTNDMHSHIEAFDNNDNKYPGQGGMIKIAHLVKEIRKKEGEILLLDAGDIFQGTPYFNMFNGEVEFKLMSEMKYDASTMGNHDFDIGLEGFKNALPFANFPFICSNYDFSKSILNDRTLPYKIMEKKGIKIGIIGIGIKLEGLVSKKLYGDTNYLDPIKTANKYAAILKNEKKCQLVICLSHLGYEYNSNKISDIKLAKNTANIDVILGGHTHTFFEKARIFENKNGDPVIINQAGWAALSLGRIDLIFDNKKSQKFDLQASINLHKTYAKF